MPARTKFATSVLGLLLCRAYACAWRPVPPPLGLSLPEVAAILPQLIDFGGVGLVWPRLRDHAEAYGAAGMALEHGYRQQVERNREAPARIVQAVTVLRDAGIEPVLLKGWSVSRHYPPGVVRLSGDIDLIVRPDEFRRAEAALADARDSGIAIHVDLHHDDMWVDRPRPDFRDFTETIDVEGVAVRVLGPELQLHVLCHHFMRHACLRPLWLCDVALMLESRPAGFDWNLCLGDDRRRRGWVVTALGLAHALLGAEIDDTPVAQEAKRLPGWLIPAVFDRWEKGERPPPAVFSDLDSRGLLGMLAHRWLEPIGATIYLEAPFNDVPRLPIQLVSYVRRVIVYGASRMPRQGAAWLRRRRGRGPRASR
jgi:hypothetical protein